MGKAYYTIAIEADKCNVCNDCVKACAAQKDNTSSLLDARISVSKINGGYKKGFALCKQCGFPQCAMVCPSGALKKDEDTGVVLLDESECMGCQLCTMACAYGGVRYHPTKHTVIKCDLCGGDPACVKACKYGALKLMKAGDIYNRWGELEDLFVPGMSFCLGCNSELMVRHTLRRVGPNTVVATPPGCVAGVGAVGVNGFTATKTPVFHPLLTNTAAMLAGAKRYYNRIGRDVTMLALAGDGGTADVGFQSLSGAAERGEQMIYICLDNEGYMNTGAQRSSTTPYGAWTSTTPVGPALRGKTRDAKPLPIIMVMHNCEYVATACSAFMEDYYQKLEKAIEASKRGMAYIHVFSPCPTGWRFHPSKLIEIGKKAVLSNMVPLWEYQKEKGSLTFTHPVENPIPVEDYLFMIGKYKHLSSEQIRHIQEMADERIRILKGFVKE